MVNVINKEALIESLKDQLNRAMIEAAEPIVRQSLEQIEREMRMTLAKYIIARVEESVEVKTMGSRITFEVCTTRV